MRYTIEYLNANRLSKSRLTALRFEAPRISKGTKGGKPINKSIRRIFCICECGNSVIIDASSMLHGTYSCGCFYKETRPKIRYENDCTRIHVSYYAMIRRCYNPKDGAYGNYGGRGVTVCEEWRNDYSSFLNWSLTNGWELGLELDKDILGDGTLYSPETCKWVTEKENNNHRRDCRRFMFNGELLSVTEIADIVGINRNIIYYRLNTMGMNPMAAFTTPKMDSLQNIKRKKWNK